MVFGLCTPEETLEFDPRLLSKIFAERVFFCLAPPIRSESDTLLAFGEGLEIGRASSFFTVI